MNKFNFIIIALLFSTQSFAKTSFVNDLNCENYITEDQCNNITNILNDKKISNYGKLTFENQLKKITSMIYRKKEKIAMAKYEYFFEILEDELTLDKSEKTKFSSMKDDVWTLLLNYSKSEDYNSNIEYK